MFARHRTGARTLVAVIDGCQEAAYQDRTAADADRDFDWDFPFAASPERCLTIRAGQSVRWVGNFSMHPLESDEGDKPNPVDAHGDDGVVTFRQPGLFGFRCNFHFEMRGAIQVLAAPPPAAAVPWSGVSGPLLIAGLLLLVGLMLARTLGSVRRSTDRRG